MSGIEIAGLLFGVVPILVEILKAYRQAGERLATFKRYNKAVVEIQLDFRLEESSFRNDCHHLLATIISDEHELQRQLQHPDTGANQWYDREVNDRLQRLLGCDYAVCEEVVIKIRDMLRETMADLESLSRVSATTTTDSSADVFRRIRHAFNVSAKENRYKRVLHELSSWNAKFRRLRKQRCALYNPRHFSSASLVSRRIPSRFSAIHEASKTLHSSLEDAWSCSNKSHEAHQAKLWLNADADYERVRLNIAISCRQKDTTVCSSSTPEPPLWLYVQSVTTQACAPKPTQSRVPLTAGLMSSMHVKLQAQPSSQQSHSKIDSFRAGIKKCTKRVRFDTETTKDDDIRPPPLPKEIRPTASQPGSDEQCHVMLNLRNTESFCGHISGCKSSCLGFLQSQDTFRFIFYDAWKQGIVGHKQPRSGKEALPLNKTLSLLGPLHRLTLALKLATAVLQYHSTPWLAEDWNLKDLAFFGDGAESAADDLTQDLETLHLSTQFPKKSQMIDCDAGGGKPVPEAPTIEAAEATSSIQTTNRYTYGIRNMTLAKLGLALLEIGHKKEIGSFQLDQQQHDVIGARILADSAHTELGPRYQRIARKCLDCNFSAEDDLGNESLRNAVYTNVVCELEQMTEDYKKFLGAIA